jgi:hypothetical protein
MKKGQRGIKAEGRTKGGREDKIPNDDSYLSFLENARNKGNFLKEIFLKGKEANRL